MLKITPTREHASLKVHLCGQLTKEYIPEIERLLAGEDGAAKNTSLDLANVTFVDRGAMMFLCSARSRNIAIENCPSYVKRWIQQEGLCSGLENQSKSDPPSNE
jgi:hypothetical protein